MSIQHQHVAARSYETNASPRSRSLLAAALRRILSNLERGRLLVDIPGGERLIFEGAQSGQHASVRIHSWKFLYRLLARGDIGFAQSYIAGEWSSPDPRAVLTFALQNAAALESKPCLRAPSVVTRLQHALNRNTRRGSRRNISAHYDLGNDFYSQWLDPSMSYSAGLFSKPCQTLDQAQQSKLERVFELLDACEGQQVLEIGCGWGGLMEQLIARCRCSVTGITLSARQLEFVRERLRHSGLSCHAELRLQDYRDVSGPYDRIVSIEMLEAVGESYWPIFFQRLRDNLRPGGIAVLQVITIDEGRFEQYRRRPDFIQKYIFPGGMLPTKSIMARKIENAGLQLVETEHFGESYARTLGEWALRFNEAWKTMEGTRFDIRFKRTWDYYFAYCQAGFECGAIDVGLYKISR